MYPLQRLPVHWFGVERHAIALLAIELELLYNVHVLVRTRQSI
jgi:hypothetical protein